MNKTLLDQVSDPDRLYLASQQVIRSWRKRRDHRREIAIDFSQSLHCWIETASKQLCNGQYSPSGYHGVAIPKKKKDEFRPVSLSTIKDQVVQRSILDTIWQYVHDKLDPRVCYCTFKKDSLMPFQGRNLAAKRIGELRRTGVCNAAKIDIANFYGSIPSQSLKSKLTGLLPDETLLPLITEFMKGILSNPEISETYPTLWIEDTGIPQGAVLSPLIACLYLRELDNHYATLGADYFRFVDDIVILAPTLDGAITERNECIERLRQDFKLDVNRSKLRLFPANHTIQYLGLQIGPTGAIKPSPKAISRLGNLADIMLANKHILH